MDWIDLAEQAIEAYGYWALGALMVVLAPETLMPFAGFLAGEGWLSLTWVILIGSLGGTLGSTLIYALARQVGEERTRLWLARHGKWLLLREQDLSGVLHIFALHGLWLVALARCVPSLRSLVSIPAGLLPMGLGPFVLLTFLGTLVWNALLAGLGYFLGGRWQSLEPLLGSYAAIVLSLLALALLVFVIQRLLNQWLDDRA